jgi:hypothetical protein
MTLFFRSWSTPLCAVVGIVIPSLWIWLLINEPDEGVRIRSSLALDIGSPGNFDWAPDAAPSTFLVNRGGTSDYFKSVEKGLAAARTPPPGDDNFERGLAIAAHLMIAPRRVESPIRADLETTHRAIVLDGRGYCADFAKVFNAIALADALPVRQWGISFDAFGSGHTFNEIYDPNRRKWILIDSFHSLYFVDAASEEPLSTIELHDRLLKSGRPDGSLRIVRIVEDRFPFKSDSVALDYYRRGMPQLYLVWGNNVFDYERTPEYRVIGHMSRSLEELLSIISGNYARMRVYPDGVSDRDVDALFAHRNQLVAATVSWLVSLLLFMPLLYCSLSDAFKRARQNPGDP